MTTRTDESGHVTKKKNQEKETTSVQCFDYYNSRDKQTKIK